MSGPKRLLATLIAVTVTLGLVSRAEATLIEIYDKTTFLTSTGASSLTGALPDLGSRRSHHHHLRHDDQHQRAQFDALRRSRGGRHRGRLVRSTGRE